MPYPPALLLTLAALFWGGNIVLGKAVSGAIPPITLSYIRWTIAFVLLLLLYWREIKKQHTLFYDHWLLFTLLGITGLMGFNICVYLALQYTSAINAGIINAFSPAFVTFISYAILRHKVRGRQWLGVLLSGVGTLWVISRGQLGVFLAMDINRGDLILLFGIFLWGVYSLLLEAKGKSIEPKMLLIFSLWMGLVATLPLFIYENIRWGLGWIVTLDGLHYLSFLYFGIFPTILAFLFFNEGIVRLGPSRASIFMNLIPMFTVILGILFLKESLLSSHVIGGIMIVMGVRLTTKKDWRAPPLK